MNITAGLAPSWYVDEDDPSVERYWNGSRWQPETRPVRAGTRTVDSSPPPVRPAPPAGDEMLRLAGLMLAEQQRANRLLAVIAFVLVAGLVLGAVVGLVAGLGA